MSRPRPWLAALVLLAVAGPLAGQDPSRVSGRVRVAGPRDTLPVADAKVVLHRVGLATQGPIDSTRTDRLGAFVFTFTPDTAASHLLSSRYADIEYFSSPLPRGGIASAQAVDLLVFDTSATALVRARSRTLVVSAPDAAGERTVVDWFTLVNESFRTRVADDSTAATWGAPLPNAAREMTVGDPRFTQFSPDAVVFRGDSVIVTAPLSPGTKALLLEYQLPAGSRGIELAAGAADSMDVFVEEPGVRVRSPGWLAADTQAFQGRTFYRHRLADPAGARLDLRFPGGRLPPGPALLALVAMLAIALAGTTAWRWRVRARPHPSPIPAETAATIADRIAQLDAGYQAGAGDEASAAVYREERATLLARLRDALAAERPRS